MESDNLFNERQSIRDSARQLKKYGSTCNHVRNNEYLIRHNLQQTDTLQGIALKYGCTVCIYKRISFQWHADLSNLTRCGFSLMILNHLNQLEYKYKTTLLHFFVSTYTFYAIASVECLIYVLVFIL